MRRAMMRLRAFAARGRRFFACLLLLVYGMFLLMLGRLNPLISIIERGDSYAALTDLMGGRVVEVDLEGTETLNPWDLPPGQTTPSKDKIAFLKNLTLHMIGHDRRSDDTLLDHLLSDAIARTYKRCSARFSNPTPTFNDLKEELANWRDEERIERTIDEAKLASIKLRSWTGGRRSCLWWVAFPRAAGPRG